MKTLALLLTLLAASCASNDDFAGGNEVESCQPGSEIELQIGTAEATAQLDGRVTALVEVSNNSDHAFTVESVRIDAQPMNDQQQYTVEGGVRTFDREVAEAEDEVFEVPITVRTRNTLDRPSQRGITAAVSIVVTVKLTDGNSARCRFVLPVRF